MGLRAKRLTCPLYPPAQVADEVSEHIWWWQLSGLSWIMCFWVPLLVLQRFVAVVAHLFLLTGSQCIQYVRAA